MIRYAPRLATRSSRTLPLAEDGAPIELILLYNAAKRWQLGDPALPDELEGGPLLRRERGRVGRAFDRRVRVVLRGIAVHHVGPASASPLLPTARRLHLAVLARVGPGALSGATMLGERLEVALNRGDVLNRKVFSGSGDALQESCRHRFQRRRPRNRSFKRR